MVRVVLAAVACVAVATLVGDDGSLSTRDVLVRETATILPPGTRVFDVDYRPRCAEGLLVIRSTPCLTLQFRLAGSTAARARTLRARAEGRDWHVGGSTGYYGSAIRFRRNDVNGEADVRSEPSRRLCRDSRLVVQRCDDYLRVQIGHDVLKKVNFVVPPASDYPPDELRRAELRLAKVKKP